MQIMNNQSAELMGKRAELLARIAAQRGQMIEIGTHWAIPLELADQGWSAVRFLSRHPVLVAAVAAVFVVRRHSAAGLMWGAWRVWKIYRQFSSYQKKLLSRDNASPGTLPGG